MLFYALATKSGAGLQTGVVDEQVGWPLAWFGWVT